jgi:hypothetical protein
MEKKYIGRKESEIFTITIGTLICEVMKIHPPMVYVKRD